MKKELLITVIVVACLIAGIAYFRSAHRQTVGPEAQQSQPASDWRDAVRSKPARSVVTPRGSDTEMEIIPDLPRTRHERNGEQNPADRPAYRQPRSAEAPEAALGVDPASAAGVRRNAPDQLIQGNEEDDYDDEVPYWENVVEKAEDHPEFYQPDASED
ncbi:MAG: hypothetical protein P9M14_11850 [Candidatus Alcyoniella australis]|nr:hypothetical protein [Candidatus Alcyoniella australis]